MIESLIFLTSLGIAGAGAIYGYIKSRRFVRDRLRFVDAAQTRTAAIIAGGATMLLLAPVAMLVPLVVDAGTVILIGLGVGAGVNAGRKDIRRLIGGAGQ